MAKMNGTDLNLEAAGPIRVNEGWLERRLKNMDERRTFLELCGVDSLGDDGVNSTSWSECARLLNHFYPDWCVEKLETRRMQSLPSLSALVKDGIYNRAGLIVPKKWKFTGGLYREILTLANETPDGELDRSALIYFFPHERPSTGNEIRQPMPDGARENPSLIGSQVLTLNHEQMLASRAAAESELSIVVGPPGTG